MANALAADANVAADRTSLARNVSVAAIRATVHRFGSVDDARESAARLARAMAGGVEGGDGDAGGDGDESNDANGANERRERKYAFAAAARNAGLVVSEVLDSRGVLSATMRVQVEAVAGEDVAAIVADAEATLAARIADGTVSSDLEAAGIPGGVRTGYLEAHDAVTWGRDDEENRSGDDVGRGTARRFRRARRRRTERAASSGWLWASFSARRCARCDVRG